jgi:hypothetical protein
MKTQNYWKICAFSPTPDTTAGLHGTNADSSGERPLGKGGEGPQEPKNDLTGEVRVADGLPRLGWKHGHVTYTHFPLPTCVVLHRPGTGIGYRMAGCQILRDYASFGWVSCDPASCFPKLAYLRKNGVPLNTMTE